RAEWRLGRCRSLDRHDDEEYQGAAAGTEGTVSPQVCWRPWRLSDRRFARRRRCQAYSTQRNRICWIDSDLRELPVGISLFRRRSLAATRAGGTQKAQNADRSLMALRPKNFRWPAYT